MPSRAEIELAAEKSPPPRGVVIVSWPKVDEPLRVLAEREPMPTRDKTPHGLSLIALDVPSREELAAKQPPRPLEATP